jgi:ElaB/YqjD/DUF883 family membrane-anchored ribosome-binding protein
MEVEVMMTCTVQAVAIDWQTVATGALAGVIIGALVIWLELRRDLI